MTRDEVEIKINDILLNKIHFNVEKLTEEKKNESLLQPQNGLMAIDLFVLYMELEKELGIRFCDKDVIEKRFDIYNNIIDSVLENLKG